MSDTGAPSRSRRALGLVLAIVAGFAVGTLGSFKYRYGLTGTPLTHPVPIGLVASLVLVGVFLLALRVAVPPRLYAAIAAIGVIAAVALYTIPGPGGSLVIVGDAWGARWTIAAPVIAVIVVGAPTPRRSRRASNRRRPNGPPSDGMMSLPSKGSTLT